MRILLLVADMHPREGGPPRVVSGIAAALAARGDHVEIVALGHPSDAEETATAWPELSSLGVPIRVFPFSGPPALGRSLRLSAFIRENVGRFDVLHIHGIWQYVLASSAAAFRKAQRPYVVSPHGMLDRWQMKSSVAKKLAARKLLGVDTMLSEASSVIFGTESEAAEAGNLPISRIAIVPNGVTLAQRDTRDRTEPSALTALIPQVQSWTRTFLFFSRLHRKKGLDLLIEAFALVHKDFPGAGLIAAAIPQDAKLERQLRARIDELRTSSIILTTDLIGADAQVLFAITDVFVLPSHQEGFSIATLEAAAAGLPVLITDKCHMPEFATSGAGLVVPDTVAGLETGLRNLLSRRDDDIKDMGRAARRVVTDNYTWERVTDLLSALYLSVSASS